MPPGIDIGSRVRLNGRVGRVDGGSPDGALLLVQWDGGVREYVRAEGVEPSDTPQPESTWQPLPVPEPPRPTRLNGVRLGSRVPAERDLRRRESEPELEREAPVARPRKWTQERIIAAIQAWAAEHGEPPTVTQWREATDDHPAKNTVTVRFGSWAAGIEAAGFARPTRGRAKPRTPASPPPAARRVPGAPAGPRIWSHDQCIAAIRRHVAEHGRTPTYLEWKGPSTGEHPGAAVVENRFGSWARGMVAAGFEPRQRGAPPQQRVEPIAKPDPSPPLELEQPPTPAHPFALTLAALDAAILSSDDLGRRLRQVRDALTVEGACR